MGALRHPEPPSKPLETSPQIAATPPHQLVRPTLGRSFFLGVFGALAGAVLMVVGAATVSRPTVWTATVVVAVAALVLRSSTKTTRHRLVVRD